MKFEIDEKVLKNDLAALADGYALHHYNEVCKHLLNKVYELEERLKTDTPECAMPIVGQSFYCEERLTTDGFTDCQHQCHKCLFKEMDKQ